MNNLRFYIDKFVYSKRESSPDLSFISANIRRKLNTFDKHVIYMLNSCFDSDCENIVLSSRYGEFRRLFQLTDQHSKLNESSPMMFSASVHNYILGQFTMLKQNTIPTLAVSAGEESFINGFVTAITAPYNRIIYCYADDIESNILGMCFRINKTGAKENQYILKHCKNGNIFEPGDVIKFFENKEDKLCLNNFCIEREAE